LALIISTQRAPGTQRPRRSMAGAAGSGWLPVWTIGLWFCL